MTDSLQTIKPYPPAPYSLLPTPYSLLPTPYSLLPAPYSLLPTPDISNFPGQFFPIQPLSTIGTKPQQT
ncbi:MAG: hypothetical protein F6J90_27395 [Moorea sp. SIOASIH]|uniref:hypothetical protein n=1 Tax=Moorena sp. SIOASIH TaxID=2607817 RepID=UPI0013BCC7CC|nr:hypothetical protein [Moorena sp. SIOASIH]NEO39856.1 hypothetical protein [Moorena sp. SIOASIH]